MRIHRIHVGVALMVALVLAASCGSKASTTSTTSTAAPPSSSTTTTTTPQSTTSVVGADTAVWPFASSTTRYTDPGEAARTFAVTFLGYVDPVMGSFQSGDSRSGEVSVQAKASGPVTTIIVRQLAPDDTWWVLGASTPTLQLQSPAALATVTSPVTLSGESTAFEATVNVEIRQDGTTTPLATGIVMGGSNGQMGPFSEAVTFGAPSATAGAIVLKVMSAEDGNISEASVVRVNFG